MIFEEEEKNGQSSYCDKLDPNSKISLFRVAFTVTWRRASEHFDCYLKISNKTSFLSLCSVQGQNIFFTFVKAKNKEEFKKHFDLLIQSKTNLSILGYGTEGRWPRCKNVNI